MRILLLGSGGQVGHELRRSLTLLGDVVALDHPQMDLADPRGLPPIVRSAIPDVIVNAAAYTAVDRAEQEPDVAHTVNATSVGVLADEALARGALLVHFSTDYVYPGTGERSWTEADATAPVNAYGRSKLAGDVAIAQSGCRHVILRTSWVYASRGKNFVRTILRLAKERDQLRVVNDQFGVPTSASFLADVAARVIDRHMMGGGGGGAGVYHAVPGGVTTWFGVAGAVLERARLRGFVPRLSDGGLMPCTTAEYPLPAARPMNSRLDTARLRRDFGLQCGDWRDDLHRVVDELMEGAST
jgi:dTDP-4-dehydrorhamnose reductase